MIPAPGKVVFTGVGGVLPRCRTTRSPVPEKTGLRRGCGWGVEEFTSSDITALRICFRANSDIRIIASGTTRSDGLVLKDVDRINNEYGENGSGNEEGDGNQGGSGGDENQGANPLG